MKPTWVPLGTTRRQRPGRGRRTTACHYGFAADDVRTVVVVRLRGEARVPVVNNVFLSLRSTRAGSVQNHPQPNPVIGVHALPRGGTSNNAPYVTTGFEGDIIPAGP